MSADTPEIPQLDAVQARILGCLVEKEATTPDTYPLTVNAAQVAANQKTAREPVMALETGQVHHALRQLESMGLVRQQFSSRAERYEHRLEAALGLTRQQTVVLALLCLRGPQTVHELFARSERLFRFADAEEVRHVLDRLGARGLAGVLPRASGQREERYAHALCGPVEAMGPMADSTAAEAPASPGLTGRVEALEAEVAELRALLEQLRQALPGA